MAVTIDSATVNRAVMRVRETQAALNTATGRTRQAIAKQMQARMSDLQRDVTDLAAQLDTQLTWLFEHPNHPRFTELEDRWLADLKHYEAACDVLNNVATQKEMAA